MIDQIELAYHLKGTIQKLKTMEAHTFISSKALNVLLILISSTVLSLSAGAQTKVVMDKVILWSTSGTSNTGAFCNSENRLTQEEACNEVFDCMVASDPSWPCGTAGMCGYRPQSVQERRDLCLIGNSDGGDMPNGGFFSRINAVSICPEGTENFTSIYCLKTIKSAKDIGCGSGQSLTSNPCNIATGNKLRSEVDIAGQGINFTRFYNSQDLVDTGLGVGWRSLFGKSLVVYVDALEVVSSSGRRQLWRKANDVWEGDSDSGLIVTETTSEFTLTKSNGAQENYDKRGRVTSEVDTNGSVTNYSYYANGELQSVTNTYGHSLNFVYANNRVASIEDQLGNSYRYAYDAAGNLTRVTFPDLTPTDNSDNPFRTYHYEDANYPNHLTGITDENGDRYATFAYNANGQAILSKLGTTTNNVGQGKIELDFQTGAQQ